MPHENGGAIELPTTEPHELSVTLADVENSDFAAGDIPLFGSAMTLTANRWHSSVTIGYASWREQNQA